MSCLFFQFSIDDKYTSYFIFAIEVLETVSDQVEKPTNMVLLNKPFSAEYLPSSQAAVKG